VNALDHQTGGDHYKGGAIEPIQFAIAHKMPAADFSVFKHIFRHRQKLGAEDVKKAIHYGQIILQEEYGVHLPISWDDYTSEPKTNTLTNPDANPAYRPTNPSEAERQRLENATLLGFDAYGVAIYVGDKVTPWDKPTFSNGIVYDIADAPDAIIQDVHDLHLTYAGTNFLCRRVVRCNSSTVQPMQS
jgi:hypothetical protein